MRGRNTGESTAQFFEGMGKTISAEKLVSTRLPASDKETVNTNNFTSFAAPFDILLVRSPTILHSLSHIGPFSLRSSPDDQL